MKPVTQSGLKLLRVIEHWGGAGMGTIEIQIQAGYLEHDYHDSGREQGAFLSCLRGLERRGLVVVLPDGIEVTDARSPRGRSGVNATAGCARSAA